MRQFTIVLIIVAFGFASCGPKITSSYINPKPKLSIDDKIALLDIHHKVPENITEVGDLRFQDSGFTSDCSFNSLMNRARIMAREKGANIVKVIEKKTPDLWSSCYRLKIKLHKYDGDVSSLSQYKLKID